MLSEARLEGARLRQAELQGAHLPKAALSGACLERADLTGAYLKAARFDAVEVMEICKDRLICESHVCTPHQYRAQGG
jgi:uncharacterized protein YjbI with pentapeptide repeats